MASNHRRSWTLETPETLQVRCRPGVRNLEGKIGKEGNWASNNLAHTTTNCKLLITLVNTLNKQLTVSKNVVTKAISCCIYITFAY